MGRFGICIAKVLGIVFLVLSAGGCASKPAKPAFNVKCGPTPIVRDDLAQFNITPIANKVTVVRIFRSNSPYCREDLMRMGLLFKDHKWSSENIQLVLIAYKKEGVESRKTFDAFVRTDLVSFGIPLESTQIVFLDKTYPVLAQSKGKSGDLIFADWKAVPYGLVFAKDGRLAYSGHFTSNPNLQDNHYGFITDLQSETCTQNPG